MPSFTFTKCRRREFRSQEAELRQVGLITGCLLPITSAVRKRPPCPDPLLRGLDRRKPGRGVSESPGSLQTNVAAAKS
jgi:hypothetical protein